MIAACETFARDFEIYSIDETFLDLAGFEGRDLVAHANAMRAQVQLWTTIPDVTALDLMMTQASTDSWIVRAFGAAFEIKEMLRARRYRWNAIQKVWWKEVRDRAAEEVWLAENVYSPQAHPKARSADFEPIDWRTRYGR